MEGRRGAIRAGGRRAHWLEHRARRLLDQPSKPRFRRPTCRCTPADGLEAGHDFLGDFNMELLLAPSPPPPPAAAPPPVEDSTGSGTAGGAPQSSAPMSAPPAASPAGPGGSGLGAALGHQQQAALGQQQGAQVHAHHSLHHAMPAYMRPLTASGSAPLPPLDPSAAAQLGGPQPMMLQLPPNGSGMQHYMAPPRNYHQPGTGPPLVLPALTAVPAGSSQQPSESNLDGKRRRGPRPRVFKKHTCQSDGCTVDLAPLSFYLQRNHICPVSWAGFSVATMQSLWAPRLFASSPYVCPCTFPRAVSALVPRHAAGPSEGRQLHGQRGALTLLPALRAGPPFDGV